MRHVLVGFFLAQGKHRGARRVGNGVRVTKVFFSAFQGMKGKKMQRPVRHKNQMPGIEMLTDRSDQFSVKRFQVALRRGKQRLLETMSVRRAHSKFRELKAQQVQ